jgi:hypothetical protein
MTASERTLEDESMLENPYRSPLAEERSRPNYASRMEAACSGALHGGLWAAKWTAIIGGAGLAVGLFVAILLIGDFWAWQWGWQPEDVIIMLLNLITALFLCMALLTMMVLLTAPTGALVMAVREAIRFRKAATLTESSAEPSAAATS